LAGYWRRGDAKRRLPTLYASFFSGFFIHYVAADVPGFSSGPLQLKFVADEVVEANVGYRF